MRNDKEFIDGQFIPFLEGIFKDVKKSGKSFYKYFDPDKDNKEKFQEEESLSEYMEESGGQYLFADDPAKGSAQQSILVNTVFAKMLKDFHDGESYFYLPDENNEFTNEQKEKIYDLAIFLIGIINKKEEEAGLTEGSPLTGDAASLIGKGVGAQKGEQKGAQILSTGAEKINQLIDQTINNLTTLAKLDIIEPLKFNPKTGLIEGKVINPNDASDPTYRKGALLTVKIDPENPTLLIFTDTTGELAFMLDNPVGDLTLKDKEEMKSELELFAEHSSREIMKLKDYLATENSIPKKAEKSDVTPQIPKIETPSVSQISQETPQEETKKESKLSGTVSGKIEGEGEFTPADHHRKEQLKVTDHRRSRQLKQPRKVAQGEEPLPQLGERILPVAGQPAETTGKPEEDTKQKTRGTEQELKEREKQEREEKAKPSTSDGRDASGEKQKEKEKTKKNPIAKLAWTLAGGAASGLGGTAILVGTGIIPS